MKVLQIAGCSLIGLIAGCCSISEDSALIDSNRCSVDECAAQQVVIFDVLQFMQASHPSTTVIFDGDCKTCLNKIKLDHIELPLKTMFVEESWGQSEQETAKVAGKPPYVYCKMITREKSNIRAQISVAYRGNKGPFDSAWFRYNLIKQRGHWLIVSRDVPVMS